MKTYWDEIKNEPTFYYGGDRGWEVHLRKEEYWGGKQSKPSNKMIFDFPFRAGDGVPRSEKAKCRKDVLFKRFKEKTLAQASSNQEEYRDLNRRVGKMNEIEFKKMIGNMKGFELRNYITTNHWTYEESFASFWRG
jgi:hypothetical protein